MRRTLTGVPDGVPLCEGDCTTAIMVRDGYLIPHQLICGLVVAHCVRTVDGVGGGVPVCVAVCVEVPVGDGVPVIVPLLVSLLVVVAVGVCVCVAVPVTDGVCD